MSDGEIAWAELRRIRETGDGTAFCFGEMEVGSVLRAGDGGTFFCHVKCAVRPGRYALWCVETPRADAIFAIRQGSEPTRWEYEGVIRIDTAVGTFLPEPAFDDLESLDEDESESFALDTIDEALFGEDRSELVLDTPGGHPMALFKLMGDGNWPVATGLDAEGTICALVVLQHEEGA